MVKIATEVRAKHHFVFDDNRVYILDFPYTESLGARYSAVQIMLDEMWKALEDEKKKKKEEEKKEPVVEPIVEEVKA